MASSWQSSALWEGTNGSVPWQGHNPVVEWMARQRWYASKGVVPSLVEIASWEVTGDDEHHVVTYLLLDRASPSPVLYHVPLSYRREAREDEGLIGMVDGWWIHDASHDRDYVASVLALCASGGRVVSPTSEVTGVPNAGGFAVDAASGARRSRVLRGEQSNTSIVVEWDHPDSTPVVIKLFRTLHHGRNPDVELQGLLSAAQSRSVPRALGHVRARWPDSGRSDRVADGDIAVAQEFLRGVRDGWQVGLEFATRDESFAANAASLGSLTAEVHRVLRGEAHHRAADDNDVERMLGEMRRRLELALGAVPELGERREELSGVIDRAHTCRWPELQRVHGDLHLAQVLDAPGRGWVMVDFEGEPLRPMNQRTMLDCPLRDVAGMMRSFDYIAGSLEATMSWDASAWAAEARESFLDAYSASSGLDLRQHKPLLDAFEIDKALYEAVYESRNRPEWLVIPVRAIERILG